MIITTIETVPGREIAEALGIARGSTVRARNVGRDIFAGLKNLVGGEIDEYTKLQAYAREQAMQRMEQDAVRLGADAVVNVRFTTAMIMQGAAEILAYGTAVKLKQMEGFSSILFILLGPVLWIVIAIVAVYLIGRRIDEHNSETFDKRDNQPFSGLTLCGIQRFLYILHQH